MRELYQISIGGLLALLLSCQNSSTSTLPFYNSTDYNPEWISPNQSNYKDIHTIGSFNFTDQEGNRIDNGFLKGNIYVANFFFTSCPSICPKLTLNMERLQIEFIHEEQFHLLSHTVMPWRDSVAVLKQYAVNMKIGYEKWKLLTGPEEEIYNLARKSYFADEQFGLTNDESDFLHTDKFILVDEKARIRGIYSGLVEEDIDRLIEDITILLDENSSY